MIVEKMLELIILREILKDYDKNKTYKTYIDNNYDVFKLEERYVELGKEFLNDYALNKTEKSD